MRIERLERRSLLSGYIAQFDGAPTMSAINAQLDSGLQATRGLGADGTFLFDAPISTQGGGNSDLAHVKSELSKIKGFKYVEVDGILQANVLPSDPLFPQDYGLNNTGQTGGTPDADIDAPEAWDVTTGSAAVVVGVIDTGIEYTHPDLAGNIWTNPGEIPSNGLDDDANGYVDDVHGYDFVNHDSDPIDDNGHGTHTSGTVGAVGNNGTGVAGVNWDVSLMALKFLSASGFGDTSGAIEAVNYATKMGADLTSNSWGGGAFSQALSDAIAASPLFVAAAGNNHSNNDLVPFYPASYPLDNIISVAATDHNDQLASFSNYGATSVDLAAPGVNILSTYLGGGYATLSGTSMATPHVAGTAALLLAKDPALTTPQLKAAILNGVDPKPNLSGVVATGGRLNAANSLGAPTTPPPAEPPLPGKRKGWHKEGNPHHDELLGLLA